MYQVLSSMKSQFAEISLTRLSQILPDVKYHRLAQDLEIVIQSFFNNDIHQQKLKTSQLRLQGMPFQKKQFFELISKPLLRMLKREQKKLQQLIQFHSRPSGQEELNRIKLDKILRECFAKIQGSTRELYNLIDEMEGVTNWQCNCRRELCKERQSFEQFCIDVFGFFYRSSKIINQEIKLAQDRGVQLHSIFIYFNQPRADCVLGYKTGELYFQLQKNCQLTKARKKRNKKSKQKQSTQVQNSKLQEVDLDEIALNSLIESIDLLKQEKEPCFVTEEWLQKLVKRKDSLKK